MLAAGLRNKRATFQRNGAGRSALGGGAAESWSDLFSAFATIRYGTSAERRAAAGEQAVQSATIRVLANPSARAVTMKDRVQCDGLTWDITGVAPIGGPAPQELEFTVMASLG
ncbi:MAG: head-tail adaptor protein [Caulobacteraceae bacterium]|nr:head-tail adaptor protein [Caulobacteraceae bacterium]